ncbi:hypothetical protein [Epilithonimonas arachidiradicis]|nr:hypothetical protein [Epilithonimonas arachidiradicis]
MKCRNHGPSVGTLFVELRMTLQIPEETLTAILDQLVQEKKITIKDSLNGLVVFVNH